MESFHEISSAFRHGCSRPFFFHFHRGRLIARFPENLTKIVAMNPLLLNRRLTDLDSHNDKVDSIKLANLSFYTELLKPSYIGSMNFYHMRDFIRSFHKSKVQQTRLRSRLFRVLDSLNIKFRFDFSREWSLLLLDHFLSRDWTLFEAYSHLIDTMKKRDQATGVLEKQLSAILLEGDVRVPPNGRKLLQTDLARYLHEDLVALSFLQEAEALVVKDPDLLDAYQKLIQLPGMGSVGALTILLELGDYRRFQNWRALAKYCGVVPLGYESGETKMRGHINRFSNKFLRTSLYRAAGTLINKTKRDSDLAEFAHRQYRVRGLPYKKAAIKVSQKFARVIFMVLVLQVPYDQDHERKLRKSAAIQKKIASKQSLLESPRTRALRRQVQNFLVTNYEFLNSTSKYHLKQGFTRLIDRLKYEEEANGRERKKNESL